MPTPKTPARKPPATANSTPSAAKTTKAETSKLRGDDDLEEENYVESEEASDSDEEIQLKKSVSKKATGRPPKGGKKATPKASKGGGKSAGAAGRKKGAAKPADDDSDSEDENVEEEVKESPVKPAEGTTNYYFNLYSIHISIYLFFQSNLTQYLTYLINLVTVFLLLGTPVAKGKAVKKTPGRPPAATKQTPAATKQTPASAGKAKGRPKAKKNDQEVFLDLFAFLL